MCELCTVEMGRTKHFPHQTRHQIDYFRDSLVMAHDYGVPIGGKLGNEMVQIEGPLADQSDVIVSPIWLVHICT